MSKKRKPTWLKMPYVKNEDYTHIKQTLKTLQLHTVCEEAHCPNINECWSGGTATFMILGDQCTRACKFCHIKTKWPDKLIDKEEPKKLAHAVRSMQLDYVVITSVDRDDLPDGGAQHFADCIKAVKAIPNVLVEVLIPDFQGNKEQLQIIIDAQPDVIAHNIETVKRLQKEVRDKRANYKQSLQLLQQVKQQNNKLFTKSSIMVGLGETHEEIFQAMQDLREHDVDIVTLGQYLQPSKQHLDVVDYVKPETFNMYKQHGESLGFLYVAAGPFVRSSYKAGELFIKNVLMNHRSINHAHK